MVTTTVYGQDVTLRFGGAGKIGNAAALGPCYFYRGELANEIQADEEKKFLLLNLILKRMRIDFNTLCTKIEATSAHL
jgi:hypothetical protein